MPAIYGRSASEDARLRAARRRAGIAAAEKKRREVAKPRDSRTVSTVRRETAEREKAKRDFPTKKPIASTAGQLARRRGPVPGHMAADAKLIPMFQRAGLNVSGTGDSGLIGNAFREGKEIVTGLPKATVMFGREFKKGYSESKRPFDVGAGLNRALVGPQVEYVSQKYGPLLPGGRPASETTRQIYEQPLSTALDLFGISSLAKGGLTRTAKVSKARAAGKPIGQAIRDSKRLEMDELRSLKYQQAGVRPRTSTNPLMRSWENMYDSVSEALGDRGGPLSAQSRVAKQGAKDLRQEGRRAQAAGAVDARAITGLGGRPVTFGKVKSRGERTAFAWEVAMPESLRGGEGLKRLAVRFRELAAEADNPKIAQRLRLQASRAERSIGKKYDPDAIEGARRLMDERARIMQEAGVISDEALESGRTWLARELGADDAAGAVFYGHRTQAAPKAIERIGRVRSTGGKSRTPPGIGQQRTGAAFQQGRVRVDPDVIVEDWMRAQHYDFLNRSKDFLAAMGEPIPQGSRPPAGWFVVNRNGHKLPRTWKDVPEADAAQAAGYGDDLNKLMADDLREYGANVFARADDPLGAELLRKSHPDDLVMVAPNAVKSFFNQYVGPQGAAGKLGKLGEGLDAAFDLVRLSTIYANPGYIPANLIGNTAMAVSAQGPFFLPGNLVRSSKALMGGDKKFRDLLLAEVGFGPSVGLASTGTNPISRGVRKVAKVEGHVADDLLRGAAWMHAARKQGHRTSAEQMKLLTDPKLRDDLNHVRGRVNADMVDFERLGPVEKAVVGRILFVWPWIRGAAAYPVRFAADYPARTAVAAHAALQAEESTEDLGARPAYLKGAIPVGPEQDGYRPIVNPTSASTPSTPLELGLKIASLFSRDVEPQTVLDTINPGITAVYDTLGGRVDYGDRVARKSVPEAALENLEGLTSASLGFARDFAAGNPDTKIYRPGREQLIRRRVGRGVIPYDVNVEEMHARGRQQQGESKPAGVRDHEERMTELRKAGRVRPAAIQASRRMRTIDAALSEAEKAKGDNLTYEERTKVLTDVYFHTFPTRKPTWDARFSHTKDDAEWERWYKKMRAELREPLTRELAKARR